MVVIDRVQLLYLDQQGFDDVRYIGGGFSETRFGSVNNMPSTNHPHPKIPRLPSNASTASASTVQSNTSSRKTLSTARSTASTVDTNPPVQPLPTLNQQIQEITFNRGHDLICLFEVSGCMVRHQITEVELWIAHSITHFGSYSPPPESLCSFCDIPPFKSSGDNLLAWRNKMIHIKDHVLNHQAPDFLRPDFLTINYMSKWKLISPGDYKSAMGYTERPYCSGLVPNTYETKEMRRRKETEGKASHGYHNLKDEDKQRRKRSG